MVSHYLGAAVRQKTDFQNKTISVGDVLFFQIMISCWIPRKFNQHTPHLLKQCEYPFDILEKNKDGPWVYLTKSLETTLCRIWTTESLIKHESLIIILYTCNGVRICDRDQVIRCIEPHAAISRASAMPALVSVQLFNRHSHGPLSMRGWVALN